MHHGNIEVIADFGQCRRQPGVNLLTSLLGGFRPFQGTVITGDEIRHIDQLARGIVCHHLGDFDGVFRQEMFVCGRLKLNLALPQNINQTLTCGAVGSYQE